MSPHALWTRWPSIRRRLGAADRLALFLDYDGTLAPIAGHPAQARLPEGVRVLLRRLAAEPGVMVSVVSGRSLRSLRRMVRVGGVYYVGNHGLEARGPSLRFVHPRAAASRARMRRIASTLRRAVAPIRGAWVEDKELTLSLHYRRVAPDRVPAVRRAFGRAVRPDVRRKLVRITPGQCVLEVRPSGRWTKGSIVRWLLARLTARSAARAGAGRILPLYVGDDLTDEDAFRALRGRGMTIAVAPVASGTSARYCVRGPADVRRLLRAVLTARRRVTSRIHARRRA